MRKSQVMEKDYVVQYMDDLSVFFEGMRRYGSRTVGCRKLNVYNKNNQLIFVFDTLVSDVKKVYERHICNVCEYFKQQFFGKAKARVAEIWGLNMKVTYYPGGRKLEEEGK